MIKLFYRPINRRIYDVVSSRKDISETIEKRYNMIACETYEGEDKALIMWISLYNEDFPHSARRHQTPEECGKESYI